jgi:hypothetical protein
LVWPLKRPKNRFAQKVVGAVRADLTMFVTVIMRSGLINTGFSPVNTLCEIGVEPFQRFSGACKPLKRLTEVEAVLSLG